MNGKKKRDNDGKERKRRKQKDIKLQSTQAK